MTAEDFLVDLEGEVRAHPALHHPFLLRFAEGGLGRFQLWAFGLQHYQLVRLFTAYLEALLASVPDQVVRDWIHRVLEDEFARPDVYHRSHPALYRRFLLALGLEARDWDAVAPLPETRAFTTRHLELTSLRHHLVGLGAVGPGHEWSIPVMFISLVKGLRGSGIAEDALEYFSLHIAQDLEHARLLRAALARSADDPADQARILEGARASLDARARFWDGLYRVVFEECRGGAVPAR